MVGCLVGIGGSVRRRALTTLIIFSFIAIFDSAAIFYKNILLFEQNPTRDNAELLKETSCNYKCMRAILRSVCSSSVMIIPICAIVGESAHATTKNIA